MVKQELLTYIQQNYAAGFTKPAIEKVLLEAGWASSDVLEAFSVIESSEIPTVPLQKTDATPVFLKPTTAVDMSSEEARIKQELIAAAKKHVSRFTPAQETKNTEGIIGWLVEENIVRNEFQAKGVLLCFILFAISITLWINWPKSGVSNTKTEVGLPRPTPTQQ